MGHRPAHLTGFVGREAELTEIRSLLGSARLLTLTGGGGSGKTRLAAEFMARFRTDFTGEVVWVDLAPLSVEELLPRHLSAQIGLVEDATGSPTDAIAARLRGLDALLILDNCEHLVAACADLCHALLGACPRLRILATSREALGVGGETAWLVPPLPVPTCDDAVTSAEIEQSEAVQLFVDRARAVRPGFALDDRNAPAVARICRRLDGIPLALELAAARVRVLTPEQIADRLHDLFGLLKNASRTALPRHRTLREAIDWSYALLDETERTLFRRLSVFRGGWTLEAAEAVCADDSDLQAASVLDRLTALVDKSLIRADLDDRESRFELLEPVRQFALEQLRCTPEFRAIQERHALYFVILAESMEPHIRGGTRHTPWMDRLEAEHANLRTTIDWFDADDTRLRDMLRLEVALFWFYFAQGLFREPQERITNALRRAVDISPQLRGRTLTVLGHQAMWRGDYSQALSAFEAAVAILRTEDDADYMSLALTGLGAALGLTVEDSDANTVFDEAQAAVGGIEGARADGFPRMLLLALSSYWRGMVARARGDLICARAGFEMSVGIARWLGRHPTIAHPLAELGDVLTSQGELDAAADCLAESFQIHRGNDDRWGLSRVLGSAARLASAFGEPERAARLLGGSDRVRTSMGATLPPHEQIERGRLVDLVSARIGPAAFEHGYARGSAMTTDEVAADMARTPSLGDVSSVRPASGLLPATPPNETFPDSGTSSRPSALPPSLARTSAPGVALYVRALGPLEIACEGQVVDGGRWGSTKPRELLLFLLTRPDGAHREQVGQALWPDAPPDRIANSFHVTLHRLRKALGHSDWIVASEERYRVRPDLERFFDVEVFERDVPTLLREVETNPRALEPLAVSLAVYRGPFLCDEVVGEWHLDIRDRLSRIHVDALMKFGGVLGAQGRHTEAADAYRRATESDELHEGAYRELMRNLSRAGDRPQALRLFQRLATLLESELDARPEEETVRLYERLQSAEPV